MDRAWLNAARKLEFKPPVPFLRALRELEPRVASSGLPDRTKALRTNDLKQWRELREAALFCHGFGRRIGQTVFLARGESQDYDFVASWMEGGIRHFSPVQLKEVVPTDLNSAASLAATIAGLSKYVDSKTLTVAIYLNQATHLDPELVVAPSPDIAGLWVFGSVSKDGCEWGLWGDFLDKPVGTRFSYPT